MSYKIGCLWNGNSLIANKPPLSLENMASSSINLTKYHVEVTALNFPPFSIPPTNFKNHVIAELWSGIEVEIVKELVSSTW